MRKLSGLGIRAVLVLFAIGIGWQVGTGPMHIGAPPLHIPCPAGHKAVYAWEKGTTATGPGEIEYHGWTEWGSCSSSLTVSGG